MIGIEISVKIPDIKRVSWRNLTSKASRESIAEPIFFDIAEIKTNDSFNSENLQVVKAINISPYMDLNRLISRTLGEIKEDIDLRPVCLWDMTGYTAIQTSANKRFTVQLTADKLVNSANRAHVRDFQLYYLYSKANLIGIEYGLKLVNYNVRDLIRADARFSEMLKIRVEELVMEQVFSQIPNLAPTRLLSYESQTHKSLAIAASRLGLSLDSHKFSKQKEIIKDYESVCGSADAENNRNVDSKLKILSNTMQSRIVKKVAIKNDKNTGEPFFEIKWDTDEITRLLSTFN
jgi:hypothetical protein